MVWDREKGGCKPGIIASTSEVKDSATDRKSPKKLVEDGKAESCTHVADQKKLETFNICMAIEEAEMYTASTYIIDLITCLCL